MEKCNTCGKKLSKREIDSIIFYCGADAEDEWWGCDKCCDEATGELLDTLSEAMYGEAGYYNSFDEVDVDDFPGHKG